MLRDQRVYADETMVARVVVCYGRRMVYTLLKGFVLIVQKTGSPVFINVDQAKCPTPGTSPCKNRGTKEYAGMVELVDSVDLGAVTSVKVFRFRRSWKTEYAGMMKLVNIQDLGSCAQA